MELRPPLHLSVVAIEKGAFGSPSTKVANFTYLLYKFRKISSRILLLNRSLLITVHNNVKSNNFVIAKIDYKYEISKPRQCGDRDEIIT